MKILVTGAHGFIGRNLCERLKALRDGKDPAYPEVDIEDVFECGRETPPELLRLYCGAADFVFHLAGVNRPADPGEFETGNVGVTKELLRLLKERHSARRADCQEKAACPVMFASSVQASLSGRYEGSPYGSSKRRCEELVRRYGLETGAEVYVYRFPNVFGKWCRPDYNSVVATFCYRIARDLPVQIHESGRELELLYIDDLVEALLKLLEGKAQDRPDGEFCQIPATHRVTLEEIAGRLKEFHDQPNTLMMPEQPADSFEKKLYATYLSYLPKEKIAVSLTMHRDGRGSFTELLRSRACGQISVNISKPGITKGQHWHHTKWELFIVVSGHGLIRERRIGSEEVLEFEVSGERMEAVHMLPGYTHSIVNLSETEDLVTVMWANEPFDGLRPDTFREEV